MSGLDSSSNGLGNLNKLEPHEGQAKAVLLRP